jgi:hypothetical protein
MRGVVAVSLAYFFRRGLGTNLRSTSSLEMTGRLLRALLVENIFALYLGFLRVEAVLKLLSAPGRKLFTHILVTLDPPSVHRDTRDDFTSAGFNDPFVLPHVDVLPLGTDTVQLMFTVETSIGAC